MRAMTKTKSAEQSSGGRLVTVEGKELPLRESRMVVDARAGSGHQG
ncbi:MAG: hypothetical protein ACT4TC_24775 [Myxococcaceae bacterium]